MQKTLLGITFCIFCSTTGFGYEYQGSDLGFSYEFYDVTDKDLTFRLFTRKNRNDGVVLTIGDKTKLLNSGFKGSLPTKIVTHGYMNNGNASYIMQIKNAILDREEVNYVSLDWSSCSKNLRYDKVVLCMKTVGKYTGEFLKFLKLEGKLNLANVHLIGHSLGAHLMGYAAKAFEPQKVIGRISGLDPAGPLFEHANESERLNSNSAKFVDVIHTCRIFTGIKKPIGNIDFYPNGGYNQPGCSGLDMACHHRSSHKFFINSILSKDKYVGKKCETLNHAIDGACTGASANMGYYSDKNQSGIYYLKITT